MDVKSKAQQELENLNFSQTEMSEKVKVNGQDLSRSFRNHNFFTDRYGEEDDDQPLFSGKKKVLTEVLSNLSDSVISTYEVNVEEEEKGWFCVSLHRKPK